MVYIEMACDIDVSKSLIVTACFLESDDVSFLTGDACLYSYSSKLSNSCTKSFYENASFGNLTLSF